MIEGVFQVSELCARDIMVPRAQMDAINIADNPAEFIPYVLEKAHSRYPVYEGNRDNIIGVLLAKDLLRYYAEEEFDVRGMLRPAVFIPESKRLNVLLHDFRVNRNHIAIVVDEYGGVAGLITIEDVLEQIVGDIEDEYDFDEESGNIIASPDGRFRVRALTEHRAVQRGIRHHYSDDEVDTIGGLVTHHFGRVPHRGEKVRIDDLIVRDPARRRPPDPHAAGAPRSAAPASAQRDATARADLSRAVRRPVLSTAASFAHSPSTPDRATMADSITSRSRPRRERVRPPPTKRAAARCPFWHYLVAAGARRGQHALVRADAARRLARTRRSSRCSSRGSRAPTGWKSAALTGWAFGFGNFVTGVWWLYVSMHVYGGMAAPLAARGRRAVLAVSRALSGAGGGRLVVRAAARASRATARPTPPPTALRRRPGTARSLSRAPGRSANGCAAPCSPAFRGSRAVMRKSMARSPGLAPVAGVYGVGWVLALVAALIVQALLHGRCFATARASADASRDSVSAPGSRAARAGASRWR